MRGFVSLLDTLSEDKMFMYWIMYCMTPTTILDKDGLLQLLAVVILCLIDVQ